MKQIKTISVKRHTSIECIPLTAMFVARVSRLSVKLDNYLPTLCDYDKGGGNVESSVLMLEVSKLLNDIVEAFESDCEKEESE